MSRFRKFIVVLAAIVTILAIIGISALTTEAGGGPSNIRFEVTPSIKTDAGTWPDTQVFYRSVQSVQIVRGNWNKYNGGSSVTTTIGPEGTLVNMMGDPYNSYYPYGTYVSYPDGTRNAFAMAQWFSTTELSSTPDYCDAPKMTVSITNPRTDSATAKGVVDNRSGRYKLFVSENGEPWVDLPIGDLYASTATKVAEIRVSVDGSADYWKQCALLNWNVTNEWIEGATPTPTPSPTATPTPVKDVVFSLNPSAPTIKVDETVDVAFKIDSQGQKVGAIQTYLKFDPQVVAVVNDNDPRVPGVQPTLGDCKLGLANVVGNEIRWAGISGSGVSLNCSAVIIRLKGLKAGASALTFNPDWTKAYDPETNKLPVRVANGQVTVTNPYVEFRTTPISKEIKVGEIAEITLQLDTNGQKVLIIQALLEYDDSMLEVLDADPKAPGTQPTLGDCPKFEYMLASVWKNRLYFGAANPRGNGIVLNCNAMTIKVRGLKAGNTAISFNEPYTNSYDEDWARLPKEISNGTNLTIR